jgi:hypothetical protein
VAHYIIREENARIYPIELGEKKLSPINILYQDPKDTVNFLNSKWNIHKFYIKRLNMSRPSGLRRAQYALLIELILIVSIEFKVYFI